jgi:hypothetical protein
MEVARRREADEGKEGDRGEEVDGQGDGAARNLSLDARDESAAIQSQFEIFLSRP